MTRTNVPVGQFKLGLGIALLVVLSGCVGGYVDGGYGGGVAVAPAPDLFVFGGGFDRGRDARSYSQRGAASRGVAHSSGGRRR